MVVQALTLTVESATIGRHFKDLLLGDLADHIVDHLDICRNSWKVLDEIFSILKKLGLETYHNWR
jgi:hypothetical protein